MAKLFVAGQCTELLREVCAILSLDPDLYPVNSVTIEMKRNEAAYAVVKLFVTTDQDKAITEAVKRYELVAPKA